MALHKVNIEKLRRKGKRLILVKYEILDLMYIERQDTVQTKDRFRISKEQYCTVS